ncbi:hypothetical protein ACWC0C_09895 [Streptomyces sp. NPDC001709]
MMTHLAAAIRVLGLLTIVPGPDMAVVTRRALASGGADALAAAPAAWTETGTPKAAGSAWRTGLISNVLNPKIAVFYTGLLAPPHLPAAWAMALLVVATTAG